MPSVLALIPARGGSKSIPRKNLLPVLGKPLIAYTIEQALQANNIQRVLVTTDDVEIAEVARQYGAEVPFLRPAALAGDYSLDIDYHRHALQWLQEQENYVPQAVVNLRPTHPIRRIATIDKAISTFFAHPEVDSLRSVRLASESPFKMWRIDESGLLTAVAAWEGLAEPYNQPRQLLPLVYWQDGYIDVTRAEVIVQQGSTTGKKIMPFVIEEPAVDIDYADEVAMAERLLLARTEQEESAPGAGKREQINTRHPS